MDRTGQWLSELEDALSGLVRRAVREELAQQQVQAQARQSWYTAKEAAVYAGVSEESIRAAIKTGALRAHKRGERSVALRREDLDDWLGASA
jgi:excisionase family DNA binding protein